MKGSNLLAVEIQTERLKLVPISMQWMMDCFREYNPDITTYMNYGPPKDQSVVEENIKRSMEELKQGMSLHLVILKKDTDEFLGRIGIEDIHTSTPELGLWLKKSAHGHGYGREAAIAVKKWADDHMNCEYMIYPVDRDNVPSRKIPELLGGKEHESYDKQTADGRTLHTVVYRIFPTQQE